jgi:hypothetical protein
MSEHIAAIRAASIEIDNAVGNAMDGSCSESDAIGSIYRSAREIDLATTLLEEEGTALKAAALDLVRRWHSPQWKWDQHTGDLIKRLADAAGIDTSEL